MFSSFLAVVVMPTLTRSLNLSTRGLAPLALVAGVSRDWNVPMYRLVVCSETKTIIFNHASADECSNSQFSNA